MTSCSQFSLCVSGGPMSAINSLLNTNSITVAYTLQNLSGVTITCEGVTADSCVLLDSYVGGSVVNRSISLGFVLFDSWRFTATFSGTMKSAIAVSVQSSGSGAAFNPAQDLASVSTS